jgi:2-dehydropantoate 2-reductase
MGCLFAALLTRAGYRVVIKEASSDRVEALTKRGLTIRDDEGESTFDVLAVEDVSDLGEVSLVLVCVKAFDTETAVRECVSVVGAETAVLTVQNGLGNVETLQTTFSRGHVLAGTTSLGANLVGPATVHFAGRGEVHIGPAERAQSGDPRMQQALERAAKMLRSAGVEVFVTDDVSSLIWSKLVINVGINALTALLRVRNGALLDIEPARVVMADAVEEALAVASSLGIDLDGDELRSRVEVVARKTAKNRSSMLMDVLCGRRTEIEHINGAVARLAKERGEPAPVNELLARLVAAAEIAATRKLTV